MKISLSELKCDIKNELIKQLNITPLEAKKIIESQPNLIKDVINSKSLELNKQKIWSNYISSILKK